MLEIPLIFRHKCSTFKLHTHSTPIYSIHNIRAMIFAEN